MRKYWFISLFFVLAGFESFSQTFNNLSFEYRVAHNELYRKEAVDGGLLCDGRGSFGFNLTGQFQLISSLSINTGLSYSVNQLVITPYFFPGADMTPQETSLKMISVPVYLKYSFWKYFFVSGGPLFDIEVNHSVGSNVDNQSGMGIEMGIGGQYTINNFTIAINPFSRQHVVIPFTKQQRHQRLQEIGIGFELGYNF